MRRAYFDLTGLPPEPAEVKAFLADKSPDAYEKLIERLLASPRYGERWGRYWLDLAGYADSEGKREQDLPRPYAWRYRDYVIKSFNTDKPYDRFLLEQLAGDELADYASAKEITPELYDNLVATGFLRMAPDATWANITGFIPDRVEVIADEIDVLGSAVMGLTMKCARCHSHKFDPIPQRDYYRLVAVFKGRSTNTTGSSRTCGPVSVPKAMTCCPAGCCLSSRPPSDERGRRRTRSFRRRSMRSRRRSTRKRNRWPESTLRSGSRSCPPNCARI